MAFSGRYIDHEVFFCMICQSNSQLKVFPSAWTRGGAVPEVWGAGVRHQLLVPRVPLEAGDFPFVDAV